MSNKPYDDTFKELVELDPPAWAAWALERPATGASVIDSDLSTVTGLADEVIRQPRPEGDLLIDIEAESGHAGHSPGSALLYSVLLTHRHGLPVRSVLLLLRPEANATAATGTLERREEVAAPEPYLRFTYHVHRVWMDPIAPLLAGPLALLPLALVTNEARADIDKAAGQVIRRIQAETPPAETGKMLSVAYVLMGLRYESAVTERIFQGIQNMEDSSTYQLILQKGAERGSMRTARQMLVRQGRIKFGEPRPETVAAIEAIDDIDRLGALSERLLGVDTWDALLAE